MYDTPHACLICSTLEISFLRLKQINAVMSITKIFASPTMIKRVLHGATKKAKLLAYTTLCRPLVEYASSVWDPVLEYQTYDID